MSVLMVQVIPDGITHYFLTLTNKQTCLPFEFVMVEPRGIEPRSNWYSCILLRAQFA